MRVSQEIDRSVQSGDKEECKRSAEMGKSNTAGRNQAQNVPRYCLVPRHKVHLSSSAHGTCMLT